MKNETSRLSELIRKLRWRLDLTQSGAVEGTPLSRHSVGRYERGAGAPPLEYAAFLARLVWRLESDVKRPGLERELLEELNAAIIPYYGRARAIKSWADLSELVDRWLREGQQGTQQQADGDKAAGGTVERSVSEQWAAPWQFRAATSNFVGREAERERLVNTLQGTGSSGSRARLACIRGLGGAGKTELAYRIAEELAGDFPDGQLLLELQGSTAPVRPEEALARVVQAFDSQQVLPQAVADLRSMYRSVLHDRRVLIVADDARDAAQVRDLLPPAGSALLITTRWRFALEGLSDSSTVELSGLGVDEAAGLLLVICPRIRTAVSELAALCGYLPLALRIAGGRLASDGTLRVEHYLGQLRDERTRLAALEGDDAERSVAAVLRLSFNALTPSDQEFFTQLSVFPSSFFRQSLVQVIRLSEELQQPEEIVDQALSRLYRAGLIDVDSTGDRFLMHSLVRAFAAGELRDPEPVRERYVATFARSAEHLGAWLASNRGGLQEVLVSFDTLRADFDAGVNWAIRHAGQELADAVLIRYCREFAPVLWLRYHPREQLIPLYTTLLALGQRRENPQIELAALSTLGRLASRLGDQQEAQRLYVQALSVAGTDPQFFQARLSIYYNLAELVASQGDLRQARELIEEYYSTGRKSGDQLAQHFALSLLSFIERQEGHIAEAVRDGEEALALARAYGHQQLIGRQAGELATALVMLDKQVRPLNAEQQMLVDNLLAEAHTCADRLHDLGGKFKALLTSGAVERGRNNLRAALPHYLEAFEIGNAIELPDGLAKVCLELGDVHHELQEPDPAEHYYRQAIEVFSALNDRCGLARVLWHYGALHLHRHEFRGTEPDVSEAQAAAQLWEQALELEHTCNLPTAQEHAEVLADLRAWLLEQG